MLMTRKNILNLSALILFLVSGFSTQNKAELTKQVALVDTKLILQKYSKAQKVLSEIAKAEENLEKNYKLKDYSSKTLELLKKLKPKFNF